VLRTRAPGQQAVLDPAAADQLVGRAGGGSETEGQTSTDQASGKQSNTTEQKSLAIRGTEQKSQDTRGTDTEHLAGLPSAGH